MNVKDQDILDRLNYDDIKPATDRMADKREPKTYRGFMWYQKIRTCKKCGVVGYFSCSEKICDSCYLESKKKCCALIGNPSTKEEIMKLRGDVE